MNTSAIKISEDGKSHVAMSDERFLCFSLGTEEYAIPLLNVREVLAVPEITKLPSSPNFILGVTNLRGQIISIMDLRTKVGVTVQKTGEEGVVICDVGPNTFGFVVDSINSVLNPELALISEKPDSHGGAASQFIKRVYRADNRIVLFLELQDVFKSTK